MTRVILIARGKELTGFCLKGHANPASVAGEDIVCAAISSAAYLIANTLTDRFSVRAAIRVRDGFFSLFLPETSDAASALLWGFADHLNALSAQYPDQLQIKIIHSSNSEVRSNAET